MTQPLDAWFTQTGVPIDGLTVTAIVRLRKTGDAVTGSPFTLTGKGNGWYSRMFDLDGGKYLVTIDGSATITNPSERYKSAIL